MATAPPHNEEEHHHCQNTCPQTNHCYHHRCNVDGCPCRVACLILKVLLEDIPRHGSALAEELRRVYPADPDGARPIALGIACDPPLRA